MLESLTDKELIVTDTEKAFRVLYERYWQELLRNAMLRLGNFAEAEDAVQEVFISFWKNRHYITIDTDASAYLFGALKFCIIKKINIAAKKGIHTTLDVAALNDVVFTETELLHFKELENIIIKAVDTLPPRMKEIYELSRKEYLNIHEIAEKLQLSDQTVKNNLTEALKRLKVKLSGYGFIILFL